MVCPVDIGYAFIIFPLKVCMGILSLLPIVMAVGLALYTKNAVFFLWFALRSALDQYRSAIHRDLYVLDPLLTQALADGDSIKVIFFLSFDRHGVEVMRKSGGTQALVHFLRFTKHAAQACSPFGLLG